MGFNTVAFLLNDFMHELEKSPHAATHGLCYPPHGDGDEAQWRWRQSVDAVADEHGEPRLHSQALEMLGTFHADNTTYLRAGGNCIEKLNVVRYGKTKAGKNTVTLELPEWWDRKRHG